MENLLDITKSIETQLSGKCPRCDRELIQKGRSTLKCKKCGFKILTSTYNERVLGWLLLVGLYAFVFGWGLAVLMGAIF